MKNIYLCILAVVMSFNFFTTNAQMSPTASKDIFDWTPFEDKKMLDLFYDVLQDGRNYPTDAELLDVFGFDIEFARSHVRPKSVMYNQSKQVDPEIDPNRKLWMNLPTGIGKGIGGYPSALFNNDVYSMWQYTHLFGAWNHGLFQAPGVWADAAHKHGTDMFSGIKFFEGWTPGSEPGPYMQLITSKNADGTYKYAEPLINCLMFLGLDGINYNWEAGGYGDEDVLGFHNALFKLADEKGFDNFHIGLYTQISSLSSYNSSSLYYGYKPSEKTVDLMLNYSNGDFATAGTANSIAAAEAIGQTNHVYSGVWIVNMNRRWAEMNEPSRKKMNLVLWGEHGQSRFMSYNAGTDGFNIQENYQKLLERAFSGGNRNPANRPALVNYGNNWEQEGTKEPLSTFGGLSTMIAERPTVQGKLPFYTNFELGNGERYNYKGKMTFGNWYNMGAQDYQPTYRWLVYNANTATISNAIQPQYTHRDAYIGGSTLELTGKANSTGTDIILYRTDLEISQGNPQVEIAIKSYKEGVNPTHLYVILKKKDNDTWYEIPVGNTNDKVWEAKNLAMTGFAQGDHIEYIGLRVKAPSVIDNYQMYIGKLALTDDNKVQVAEIDNLLVEVKEETQSSMSLKLNWKVSPLSETTTRGKSHNLIYNDEANVDHFEIMYKNGADGRIKEIGRTSGWSTFIGNIIFKDEASATEEPYIGVRAASIDGKSYSKVKWVKVDRAKASQLPVYEDDRYCASEINPGAEGVDVARRTRYLTEVKTIGLANNLNYTASVPVADGTQYQNATNYSFTANQGETFKFFFKAFDASDGLKWCIAKAYIDWDNNGEFNPEKEEVFNLGTIRQGTPEFQTTGVEKEFKIPENAAPGATRLRVVFSDAWFPHPGPCGLTAKGFSIDFTINITGDNPPVVEEDKHDQGIADEPERVRDENPNAEPSAIHPIVGDMHGGYSYFYPNPADDIIHFEKTEDVWIYTIDGKLVYTQKGHVSDINISNFKPGLYLVKMKYNNVIRNRKLIKK